MNAAEARALLFQRKLAYEDYAGSLPGVPELDNLLGILELPANDSLATEKLATDASGELDQSLVLAGQVSKSLVLRETKERIFTDGDIQGVSGFGLSILIPLNERIKEISGMNQTALDTAKKNSTPTPASASPLP